MKDLLFKGSVSLFCVLFFGLPFTEIEAKTASSQGKVVTVTNFNFSAGAESIRLPIGTSLNSTAKDEEDLIGYEIKTNKTKTKTQASGLLLANLPVEDGYYLLPPHTTVSLKLFFILSADEKALEGIKTEISELPYYYGEDRTRVSREQLAKFNQRTITLGIPSNLE